MNFPQFWAKGECGNISCWRWSSQSLAEAQAQADLAAQKLLERFRANGFSNAGGSNHWGYYPDRPFREQILQEIKGSNGESAAMITRNNYGCQVLNTARVMFVDIDLPENKPAGGFFKRLFGKSDPAAPLPVPEAELAKIENWTRNHTEWGWRIYRTRAGLRLLATHGLVAADSTTTMDIFAALGTDPLYQKLCQTQKCFRARLTPKPWRCGVRARPARWPRLTEKQEKQFQKWQAHYQSLVFNWATCDLIHQTGNTMIHPEIQPIVKLHDEATRVGSKLPLA